MVYFYGFIGVFMGLWMFFYPTIIWEISESWKSNDGSEPSDLYICSIRLGGIMCILAGLGGIIAFILLIE
ncbi:DUF6199 family natural product biosynthesis protein [Paenibacillus glacialis]|uniref:DUF6199 domain-containing protein n=1 Tax=Paenibacillus glacialis TaxID=494026 RepID=A0A168L2Q8_9BACL|nr:hypothetical protein PGLA_10135 [Paenibacillus glacialis]